MAEAESADPSVYVVGAVQRTSIVVADALVKVTADGGVGGGDATVNDPGDGAARGFPGARALSPWNCALHAFPTSPAVSAASMHTTTLTALIVPGTFHLYTSGEGRLVSRLATTPFPLEDV